MYSARGHVGMLVVQIQSRASWDDFKFFRINIAYKWTYSIVSGCAEEKYRISIIMLQ